MLAVLLNLWGLCTLATFHLLVYWWNDYNYIPFIFFHALAVSSIQIIIIIASAPALLASMILGISAWITVLIQHAKAQRWGVFLLTFFFGGIMLIIYLFTDSQPVVGGPTLSPQANFPQAPPAVPAMQRRRQLSRLGRIAGGIIAAINIFWLLVVMVLSYVSPQFFSRSGPGSYAIGLPGMSLALFSRGIPLLLTLAAFFWAGKMAIQRVGHISSGVDTALRAFLWLLPTSLLVFIRDMVRLALYVMRTHDITITIFLPWQYLQSNLSFLLLAFVLGLPLAAWGARTGTPGSVVLQAGPSASPQSLDVEAYPPAERLEAKTRAAS